MPSFSLRNPYPVVVGALIISLLGLTALKQMPVDVFPQIKIPAVVVATFYSGMPPLEIERDITTRFERWFTLGSGIEHIESRSLPGVSIIKIFFHSGVDADVAAAQINGLAMADLRVMPPGTFPPLVLKFDAASLPVVLVTVEGKGFGEIELEDQARYNVRTQLATVSGVSIPQPFGGKYRQIMAYVQRDKLQARGLSLWDVVNALNSSNLILPAGDAKIGSTDYFIYSNNMIEEVNDVNQVPIKTGPGQAPVLLKDVGNAEDAAQIQYNKVLVNGQPSVYVPILKQTGANTIAVVDGVKEMLPRLVNLPAGLKLKAIFDQSGYIREAIRSLEHEAVSGSVLASLMILVFLGSLRSTIAVFLSIPLSILAAAFGLFFSGSTINIMTLGGFALAIGRLVDNSVIVLENISRHLEEGEDSVKAAREGAEEVALSVLAITITTSVVFLPAMFMFGVAKYLFGALTVAVVLSLAFSYVVAMTVIPLYCAKFLVGAGSDAGDANRRGGGWWIRWFNYHYERFVAGYEAMLLGCLNHKFAFIAFIVVLLVVGGMMYPLVGTEFFPRTDAGKFTIRFRAPSGSRLEMTQVHAAETERAIRSIVPPDELEMVVTNMGVQPDISAIYNSNSGQDTGFMLVSLKAEHKVSTWTYVRRLREVLAREVPEVEPFFSSGSIIDAVLNFGMDAPIDVQFSGPDYPPLYRAARRARKRLEALPLVEQTYIPQEEDYPTLKILVDRVKAARLGLTQKDVVSNVITALTSNLMLAPSIWIDRKTGNDYFMTAQYAESDINSYETLRNIPISTIRSERGHEQSILLRDVAKMIGEKNPSEADHYNVQRTVDILVAPKGDDVGSAQTAVEKVVDSMTLPEGVKVAYRGSVASMRASFSSMGFGLVIAVVMVYLVMVAQFRSFLDPFIVMFAVPVGFIGVIWMLLATNTTLNIESFMGTIFMVGIAVSNSILIVDFTNVRRRAGRELREAVIEASKIRMRPILMTVLATIVAMLPIAFKLGTGSEASAPLARAAIGGLAVSTVLTIFLVPVVYELLYSRSGVES